MLIHHFDPQTKIYTHSEEAEAVVENSTDVALPELDSIYTAAFIDGRWLSVMRPEVAAQLNPPEPTPEPEPAPEEPQPEPTPEPEPQL